ncbi:MAG TPA: DUF1080 domain-containing protein [Chryseosolibacter sp.]|nr:DUF1080 domain-containing protein [Chryseosolibacter sp.]
MKTPNPFFVIVGLVAAIAFACQKPASKEGDSAQVSAPNTLTEGEQAEGWQLLFDGQTLNGWKRYNKDSIGPLWSVKDGAIVCDGKGLAEGTPGIGGSLMTTRQFGNFELSIDWKISPGGNSGILYHVVEKPEYAHDYETGPEYQVMDDAGWKGEAIRPEQMAGSNYDMYAASADKKLKPVGEWNAARIIYKDGHVEHWLNGDKVLEFDEGSEDFNTRYQKSKWKEYPGWNKFKTGAISLQDHGAAVYYRNIKIREL